MPEPTLLMTSPTKKRNLKLFQFLKSKLEASPYLLRI